MGFQYEPTYSTKINDFIGPMKNNSYMFDNSQGYCTYLPEEPLNQTDLDDLVNLIESERYVWFKPDRFFPTDWGNYIQILANSEHSELKRNFLKNNYTLDWYFFYHGFAALDWFQHYKYFSIKPQKNFTHVFISYNNLFYYKRSYRLTVLAHLIKDNLLDFGLFSMPKLNDESLHQELFVNKNSLISTASKKLIYSTLPHYKKKLIIDTNQPQGWLSADINLKYMQKALWQLVTETVFYDKKLHLTEKIFKPIVAKQPFILVAAPGNLKYLKSYGFKTFDNWIDESYDSEDDNDLRIEKITQNIKQLCSLSFCQLRKMQEEMVPVLEYNFVHFYSNFKHLIVDELVDNFGKCIHTYNFDLSSRFQLQSSDFDLELVRARLKS